MHYMEIGGAESSLIGLLEALDPERVDIDLFIFSHQGIFMNAIPEFVHLLPEIGAYSVVEHPMTETFMKGHWGVLMARVLAKLQNVIYYKNHVDTRPHTAIWGYLGRNLARVLPNLYQYGEYDLAISYLNPHDIVLRNVKAKKKIAWIHTDYKQISLNAEMELPVWNGYDNIVSISPDVTKSFVEVFPTLKDKILEMENILPRNLILGRADEPLKLLKPLKPFKQEGVLTLCSCGRLGYAKNYDNIPFMAKKLRELIGKPETEKPRNLETFRWYIVGPGDYSEIDVLSEKLGVKENVIFLGPSDNPYPYIKNCDIYVHPSRYEGKSMVVREAQVLCKPVIITNYPTANSQIQDGVDGIICDQTNEAVAEAIFELANDEEKQVELIDYLKSHDMSGQAEVEKIYALLNENDKEKL